jgi:hypothetical protein
MGEFGGALNKALEGNFDPESPFMLTGPKEAVALGNMDELALERLASAVADRIRATNSHNILGSRGEIQRDNKSCLFSTRKRCRPRSH